MLRETRQDVLTSAAPGQPRWVSIGRDGDAWFAAFGLTMPVQRDTIGESR